MKIQFGNSAILVDILTIFKKFVVLSILMILFLVIVTPETLTYGEFLTSYMNKNELLKLTPFFAITLFVLALIIKPYIKIE